MLQKIPQDKTNLSATLIVIIVARPDLLVSYRIYQLSFSTLMLFWDSELPFFNPFFPSSTKVFGVAGQSGSSGSGGGLKPSWFPYWHLDWVAKMERTARLQAVASPSLYADRPNGRRHAGRCISATSSFYSSLLSILCNARWSGQIHPGAYRSSNSYISSGSYLGQIKGSTLKESSLKQQPSIL